MPTPRSPRQEAARRAGNDVHAGRRLALAVEALGESLDANPALPAAFAPHANALAHGRSTVPADGERTDFPARVMARVEAPHVDEPDLPAMARDLEAWLGADLTRWLADDVARLVCDAAGEAVRDAVETAWEARADIVDRKRALAEVYGRWYAEGLGDRERAVFLAASRLALEEACDRWCALGCEGSLDRYVSTWQRAAAGWAEKALGTAVDVAVTDVTRLRALQTAAKEIRAEREAPRSLPRALAARMGVEVAEVDRLLRLEAVVRDRLDPAALLRRRWALVKPIAAAVSTLERELGRMPSVTEIAARAGVHDALVELVLEALGDD